jgi:hypothetical protein
MRPWDHTAKNKRLVMATRKTPNTEKKRDTAMTATRTTATRTTARRLAAATATAAAATAGLALTLGALAPTAASAATTAKAAVQTSCAAAPSACGYPDATNTGVPASVTLKTVPTQISSGPGWTYNATTQAVDVTASGANLSGLYIPWTLDITASNVTINDSEVDTNGLYGVILNDTTGVTIENSTITGENATSGRVSYAVDDVYGNTTATTIENDNISDFRTAVNLSTGTIEGNYIHNPGYISGDHTNGIFDDGTTQPLMIKDNTIFNSLGQTDAISLDSSTSNSPVANKTVENNFIAGGGYTIYGGDSLGNTTSNITVTGNRFGQQYYTTSGQYGPDAYYSTTGTGNTWTGNIWDTNGANCNS